MSAEDIQYVSGLYGRHEGQDIYVVGTGTSMRTFPVDYLEDKIVIGCNMAWKVAPVTYGITIHPDLNVPECMEGESPRPGIIWITKYQKAKRLLGEQLFSGLHSRFYYFETGGKENTAPPNEPNNAGRVVEWLHEPVGNFLYQWSSISQTACNLAANMGARSIILVGCDNCSLVGNHHAHAQHTRWKGVRPDHRYHQYYEGLVEVRSALRDRGVKMMSLIPFANLCDPAEDFETLCAELGVPLHVKGEELHAGHHGVFSRLKRKVKIYLRKGRRQ